MTDPASSTQLKFGQARDHILEWIRRGKHPSGGKLPSERALARELSIDQRTVRRGLEDLVAAGVVIKRPRVGNFLREITPVEMVTQVALILPDWMLLNAPKHPLLPLLYQGISRVMNHDDFVISTHWYHYDRFWQDAGRVVASRGMRGALVYPSPSPSLAADLSRFLDTGTKTVLLDYTWQLDGLDLFAVSLDPSAKITIKKMMEGLAHRGHRRIVAAIYSPANFLEIARAAAEDVCRRFNLGDSGCRVLEIPSDGYHAHNEVMATLFETGEPPTAVIVPDEFVASALFRLCYERGISIPKDLSVASLVDNAPHSHPIPLTSTDWVPMRIQASELAADHLVKLLKGERPPLGKIEMRGEIQWTASVADLTGGHFRNDRKAAITSVSNEEE